MQQVCIIRIKTIRKMENLMTNPKNKHNDLFFQMYELSMKIL